jgi:hypothetical protein
MALAPTRRARSAPRPATAVLATLAMTASLCTFVGPLSGGALGSALALAETSSRSVPAAQAGQSVRAEGPVAQEMTREMTRQSQAFTSPEQVSYSLVSESNGQTPSKGTSVSVIFASKGVAWLLATSGGGDLSYQGTWSYHSSKLSLAFDAYGFDRKGTFNAELGSDEITIPFQVFTPKPGTSTWEQAEVDPELTAFSVAVADASATASGEPMATLVLDAADYVGAVTGAPVEGGASGGSSTAGALRALPEGPAAPPALNLARFASHGREAAAAQRLAATTLVVGRLKPDVQNEFGGVMHVDINSDGFDVVYKGATVNVLMATEAASDGPVESLTAGPFAANPRTNHVEQAPNNGADDPKDKTAVLFEPFLFGNQQSWSWKGSKVFATVSGFADVNYYKSEMSALQGDGYKVKLLQGDSASIVDLIQALSGASPGLLVVRTHGTSDGNLVTSDYLGHTADEAFANQESLNEQLKKDYGMPATATAVGALDVEETLPGAKDQNGGYYLLVTPDFWSWLRGSRGADFSRSLVFVGACLTDATPYLRNAILARAYFAWKVSAINETDAAITDYLITRLVKPTVTAEEVYYNLLRIDSTGQYAFRDDLILNHQLVSQANSNAEDLSVPYTPEALQYVFDAYGNSGGQMIPYIGNGWLGKGIDEGQIWTMMWAARWGTDIKQGVKNLESCEDGVWERGTVGAINSTCQDWTDGNVPSKEEVAYAVYLLTGADIGLEGTPAPVPRFTLNDTGRGVSSG